MPETTAEVGGTLSLEETKKKKSISFVAPEDIHKSHSRTNYLETLANLFKANVGTGCFGMADAVKNAGIFLGPVAIIIIAIIAIECMRMLLIVAEYIMTQNQLSARPDYARVVELTFSGSCNERWRKCTKSVKILCNISICTTQLGFCCAYFVFVSTSMKTISDYYGFAIDLKLMMTIVLVPILLTSLVRQLKSIAIFSVIANVCMVTGVGLTLAHCVNLPPLSEHHYVKFDTVPLFFGTALFAYEGIALVLPLKNQMKKPHQFSMFPFGVLHMGMLFVTIIYISLGIMGYWKYGEHTQASLTLNLPTDEILAQIVILMVALGVLLGYAIQFYVAIQIMFPQILNTFSFSMHHPIYAELIFRTIMVLFTFVIAQLVPNLGLLLSLIGSVCCTVLAFMFPSVLELITKSDQGKIGVFCMIKNMVILLVAISGFLLGGWQAMLGIYKEFIEIHL